MTTKEGEQCDSNHQEHMKSIEDFKTLDFRHISAIVIKRGCQLALRGLMSIELPKDIPNIPILEVTNLDDIKVIENRQMDALRAVAEAAETFFYSELGLDQTGIEQYKKEFKACKSALAAWRELEKK